MQKLNFPEYPIVVKEHLQKKVIFDNVRKKFVALTPEEWVRQHVVWYLIQNLKVPAGLLAVETSITINNLKKRADLVVYKQNNPCILIECKAPAEKLGAKVLKQIATYNLNFKVPYLFITNGIKHFVFHIDHLKGQVTPIHGLPCYEML